MLYYYYKQERSQLMKLIESYLCDKRTPTRAEIEECIAIAQKNNNNTIIELRWFFPNNGWHRTLIYGTETVEEVWNSIPHHYGI